jgi:DNA-binding transcriptional LysR family regulator
LLPNIVLEVETIEACKRMVLRKLGLAFLPQIAVVEELRRGKLCPLEITNSEPLRRSLDVILPRRRPLSKSAKELVAGLREATQTLVKIGPARKKPHSR